jgi:cystinosin
MSNTHPPSSSSNSAASSSAAPSSADLPPRLRLAGLALVLGLGLGLGLGIPSSLGCDLTIKRLSSVLGWTYFAAWTISFYPQCILNARRQSVVGMSFDYVALNLIGFTCYSAYNAALFFNPSVKAEYADAHGGADSAVRMNDVAFALHAAALTSFTLCQIAIYDRGAQRFSAFCKVAVCGFVLFVALAGALLGTGVLTALTVLNALSYVKLAVTACKFVPQVLLNIRRRSTVGWNVDNVLLDFTGGSLSVAQLLLDAGCTGEWADMVGGDPVKFGLGFLSMFFDAIFMLQHFVLYRPRRGGNDHASPLLLAAKPTPSPVEVFIEPVC